MHAKFTWDSCVQKTSMVYILYNQNEATVKNKQTNKSNKEWKFKTNILPCKMDWFHPDNLAPCYYNQCFHLAVRFKQSMLMP